MPLQHIDDNILASMKRYHTEKDTRDLLDELHKKVPNLSLRTTFIVGYPGETDAQFQNFLSFVKEGHFNLRRRLHLFPGRRNSRWIDVGNKFPKPSGTPALKPSPKPNNEISWQASTKTDRSNRIGGNRRKDGKDFLGRTYQSCSEAAPTG